MRLQRGVTVIGLVVICWGAMAAAGDVVVDGKVVSNGSGVQFADGSLQSSAAYPRWERFAVVDVNGRGDYADPVAAMTDLASWCPSPGSSASCLMRILPGTYDLGSSTLTLQPYVDIQGAGRDVTTISTASTVAVVSANRSHIRGVSIANNAALSTVTGVAIDSDTFTMKDVRIVVHGSGSIATGISAMDAQLLADDVEVIVSGGTTTCRGILTDSSSGLLRRTFVSAGSTGAALTEGIRTEGAYAPEIEDSEIWAVGGDTAYGIVTMLPDLMVQGTRVRTESQGAGEAVSNQGGVVEINGGWIQASGGTFAYGVRAHAGTTVIRDTRVEAENGTSYNRGVHALEAAQVRLERTTVTVEGGVYAWGFQTGGDATVELTDVIARVADASSWNYGMEHLSSAPFVVRSSLLEAAGGTGSWGVLNASGGQGGTIDHSTASGGTVSVRNDNGAAEVFVGGCKLDGGVTANLTCIGNFDASYTAVTCP